MKRRQYKTKRLIIRPHEPRDYIAWKFAYTKCLTQKSKWDRGPMSEKDCTRKIFNEIVARHNRLSRLDHTYVLAIYEKKSGNFVGNIDIFIICRDALQIADGLETQSL